MKVGTLKGILWHQGESDSNDELATTYEQNVVAERSRGRFFEYKTAGLRPRSVRPLSNRTGTRHPCTAHHNGDGLQANRDLHSPE